MQNAATHLVHAVRTRDYARLRQLIAEPAHLAARTKAGRTALHAACEEGDLEAIRLLLDAGADINARTCSGETPLHFAAAHGGIPDLLDPDDDRRDPFRRGRRRGELRPDTVAALTEILKSRSGALPADLGTTDTLSPSQKREAILAALDCFSQPELLISELKERGIDLDRTDPDFAEELRGNPRFLGVVEHLLSRGADISARDERGATPLHGAIERGLPQMVELLLLRGADPNPADSTEPDGGCLVSLALDYGKTRVADTLLRHGARFDFQAEGRLHNLAGNNRSEVVLWLLDHGADINGRDSRGDTPLISAAGHADLMALLLSRGADPRVKNARGSTVLHACAVWPPCLQLLLPLGLPLDEPDADGDTPFILAAQGGSAEAVRMLAEAGANVNIRNSSGATALHRIFDSDEFRPDIEFPVFLAALAAGVDRSTRNNDGLTAFDLASKWDYPPEYLELLDPDPSRTRPASDFIWLGAPACRVLLPDTLAPIQADGETWPSSAHYFQAQKTADPALREKVRLSPTLDAALDHLHASKTAPPPSWNARCDAVMRQALLAKIQSNPAARETLFSTGTATLVSDGNSDSYWFENRHAGFNPIGRMLMSIRDELRPPPPFASQA